MGLTLQGATSNNLAEVDALNQLLIRPAQTATNAGYNWMTTLGDEGTITGSKLTRDLELSSNRRLRQGTDTPLWSESFNYTAQNTNNWGLGLTTMTVSFASGYLSLNSGSSVASGAVARIISYRYFPLYGEQGVSFRATCIITQTPQTSNIIEMGFGVAPASTAAVTDGILFRYSTGGILQGVLNFNGAETTATLPTPTSGVDHIYMIRADVTATEFWVDGVLQATIATPAGQSGPCLNPYQPIFFRNANSAATAVAQVLRIAEVHLFARDVPLAKSWPSILAGMGQNANVGGNGETQGSTAQHANNTTPAAATPTNTTAALGTGFGGQFQMNAQAAAATDFIVQSYQNPSWSVNIPAKTILIYGVKIAPLNLGAAVATTATSILWTLNVGHSNVSLATTEAANTKAPRRIELGISSWLVGAAVGAQPQNGDVWVPFTVPLVVYPGEFVAVSAKFLAGTATASQVIFVAVTFDAVKE